jgi:hypothetical protein
MGSMTEADWWQDYVLPYLTVEFLVVDQYAERAIPCRVSY